MGYFNFFFEESIWSTMSKKGNKTGIKKLNTAQQQSTEPVKKKKQIKRIDKNATSTEPVAPKKTVARRDKNATVKHEEQPRKKGVARRDKNATVKHEDEPSKKGVSRRDKNATSEQVVKKKGLKIETNNPKLNRRVHQVSKEQEPCILAVIVAKLKPSRKVEEVVLLFNNQRKSPPKPKKFLNLVKITKQVLVWATTTNPRGLKELLEQTKHMLANPIIFSVVLVKVPMQSQKKMLVIWNPRLPLDNFNVY